MSRKLTVAIVGATGATGGSIARVLLSDQDQFEVIILARAASLNKPELTALKELGAAVRAVDLDGPIDYVANVLAGTDVVVSGMTLQQMPQELNLALAAKQANVGRFVTSFFAPVCPPGGVTFMREKKEEILNHIKKLYLPYTAVDVGWWYQMTIPRPLTQPADPKAFVQPMPIVDEGNVRIALTDNRDIAPFVARIIADERTLNHLVFVYGEVKTTTEAWSEAEAISGVSAEKKYASIDCHSHHLSVSEASLLETIEKNPGVLTMETGMAQYFYTLAVRGDNTPENAKYLGYLDARELYPDLQPRSWRDYIMDLEAGQIPTPYPDRK
ncbi:isoflavone reductase family protein [Verticillium alfalfae VaMs.102]|uniref:Isoflavone reductase family protein n=1 Tax=Verticillium alfalfae (strain VaMs.102 / ATCC MYA-4576 / FGSC 10136) TaxID=526221 RepID=C9SCI1_VERA1|nr:isoflavone reductase family protein [Verticillium alfalfae VaMs.102]EEY16796.1 isoflavone reductase family protein [Verticillium alfalfae VaMs.102]